MWRKIDDTTPKMKSGPIRSAGFSLVELLVVIAVIGLIAAIAIPQLSKVSDQAKKATAQRNAQNCVSVFAAAASSGAQTIDPPVGLKGLTDKSDVVDALVAGVDGVGLFSDAFFQIAVVSQADRNEAEKFLSYDTTNDLLTYDSDAAYP